MRRLEEKISEYKEWYNILPNLIAVLGRGIIIMDKKSYNEATYEIIESSDNALEEFFISLLGLLDNKDTYTAGSSYYKSFYEQLQKKDL